MIIDAQIGKNTKKYKFCIIICGYLRKASWTIVGKLFINTNNSSGSRTDFCGMPDVRLMDLDFMKTCVRLNLRLRSIRRCNNWCILTSLHWLTWHHSMLWWLDTINNLCIKTLKIVPWLIIFYFRTVTIFKCRSYITYLPPRVFSYLIIN